MSTANLQGTVVLGFGPQAMDWLSKASKICGNTAVIDPDVARMAGANMAAGTPEALADLRKRLEPSALQGIEERLTRFPGAARWLAVGERGMSSEALFTRLSGIEVDDDASHLHPADPDDFRRCRLMLESVPALASRLQIASDLSATWAALIAAWPELCGLMDEESPDWRSPTRTSRANRLYERMRELQGR